MTLDELEKTVRRMRRIGCVQFDGIVISLTPPYGQKYDIDDNPVVEPVPPTPETKPRVPTTLKQFRDRAGV